MPSPKLLLAIPAALAFFAAAPAAAQSPCGATHTVRTGDTLYSLARRCGTSVPAIMAANSFIRSAGEIETGWRLAIPGGRGDPGPAPAPAPRDPVDDIDWDDRRDYPPRRGDRNDMVELTGFITREGVECPALRAEDGALFTLAGDIGRFAPGDRVKVRGRIADMSYCRQGRTIDVRDIAAASWDRR